MAEGVTEFAKNAGLVTILHLLLTAIVIIMALVLLIVGKTRTSMRLFLIIGVMPAVSGILALYLKCRMLATGIGMFGRLTDAGIAFGKREAVIDLVVGLTATALILVMRSWRQKLNNTATIQ